MCQCGAVRGHRVVGAVAPPARLADGLSDDEVFTSSTGALWGGGRARWGDEILTGTADRLRGGGGVPATGSSSGEGGDIMEHREADRG
jgi:hypothetical protein